MEFAEQLHELLPGDLPNREAVVRKAAQHLELIVEANQYLNLTRITSPREAAIKHVLDSVIPWRLFADAGRVLDAGTGAGFPGIPMALVLPSGRFTLAESIQKKARFVEGAIGRLELPNVAVSAQRAEELARTGEFELIAARAVAPLPKALDLFGSALRKGSRLLLYKGPDIEEEIASAGRELRKHKARVRIVMRYELPEAMGSRVMAEVSGG